MNNTERFNLAADSLGERLCAILNKLDDGEKASIREIRCRVNSPVIAVTADGVRFFSSSGRLQSLYTATAIRTDKREIEEIFRRMCAYSVHSFKDSINSGYVTVNGGHRAGVAGTAVTENGRITAVKDISAINLRIAREIKGAANGIFENICCGGLESFIVAGPPSSGKTTVLRDFVRQISGEERGLFAKAAVCDERGEIGASVTGVCQHDLGLNCDLLTSYPKAQAVEIALRSFSPDIIVCDEIVSCEEVKAIEAGINSGVSFALSIHARDENELKSKKTVKELLSFGGFRKIFLLSRKEAGKTEKIFEAGDLIA